MIFFIELYVFIFSVICINSFFKFRNSTMLFFVWQLSSPVFLHNNKRKFKNKKKNRFEMFVDKFKPSSLVLITSSLKYA